MEKNSMEGGKCWVQMLRTWNSLVREGLAERVTFEDKLEGGEGVFQAEGMMTSAWGLTREPAGYVVGTDRGRGLGPKAESWGGPGRSRALWAVVRALLKWEDFKPKGDLILFLAAMLRVGWNGEGAHQKTVASLLSSSRREMTVASNQTGDSGAGGNESASGYIPEGTGNKICRQIGYKTQKTSWWMSQWVIIDWSLQGQWAGGGMGMEVWRWESSLRQ